MYELYMILVFYGWKESNQFLPVRETESSISRMPPATAWEMTMIQGMIHVWEMTNHQISNAVTEWHMVIGVTHPRVILAWHGWFWVWPGGFTIIYIPLVWPWVSRHMDMQLSFFSSWKWQWHFPHDFSIHFSHDFSSTKFFVHSTMYTY